jgi:hypothetical protein
MGQFDSQSVGLQPVGRIGLSDSDRGVGLPERTKPIYVATKKKPKTQAQAAPPRSPGDGRNWRTDEEDLKKKFRKERENRNKKK